MHLYKFLWTFPRLWESISKHLAYAFKYGPQPDIQHIDYDNIGLTLIRAIAEQSAVGWGHMLRGRISPLWGKIQNDYYCERHLDRTNRPAHLNGPSFQVQLISCMFDIFLGIWKQRNTIIHDAEVGRIYESAPSSNLQLLPLLYLLDCDYDLVRSKYPLAEAQISVARDLIPFSQIAPQVRKH